MPPRPEPRASTGLRLALSVAVLAASLGSLTPRPALARALAEPAIPETADEHYERGIRERDAGRFAAAAAEFAVAYAQIPATQALRAGVLFDLVDAHRSAFTAGGRVRGREHPAAHLCAAELALTEFIAAAEKKRTPKAKRSLDLRKAEELRAEVRNQLDAARQSADELSCASVEFPGEEVEVAAPGAPRGEAEPASRTVQEANRGLVIAGAASTGLSLIFFGLMARGLVRGKRAERDGDALVAMSPTRPEDDPLLQAIDRRGTKANQLAIAGGVIGVAALGTGIALVVIGLRGGPSSRVALSPSLGRRALGLSLRWRF